MRKCWQTDAMHVGEKHHKTRWGAIAIVGLLAVLLSGCASEPTPDPTSKPMRPVPESSEAAPSVPVPTLDPLTRVASIVARPDAIELRDAGNAVIKTLSYMGQPAEAIATLTTVFGAPPVDEPYDGGNHRPDGIMHTWEGFVLDERFYDEQRRIDEELDFLTWPRFAVYLDAPEAFGKTLASVQGIQAGDSWESASAAPEFNSELYTCIGTPIETLDLVSPAGDDRTATVVLTENDENGTVKWVGAPEMVADGCA